MSSQSKPNQTQHQAPHSLTLGTSFVLSFYLFIWVWFILIIKTIQETSTILNLMITFPRKRKNKENNIALLANKSHFKEQYSFL